MAKPITVKVEVLGILKVGDKWYLISEAPAREITSEEAKRTLETLAQGVV